MSIPGAALPGVGSRFRHSKVNIGRCSACGFVTTEGWLRVIGHTEIGQTIYACKSVKACKVRANRRAARHEKI